MGQRQMNTERVQVAATLRRMREEVSLTREQAAEVLSCTTSKIGDLETGRSSAKPIELAALLNRYGGQRRRARRPDRVRPRVTDPPAPGRSLGHDSQ